MKSNNFWKFPWGYKQNILILLSLWVAGGLIGNKVLVPLWPVNLALLGAFVCSVTLIYLTDKNSWIVNWLFSMPMVLTFICGFGLLSICNLTQGWSFAFNLLLLLAALLVATFRRLLPFNIKNIAFVLNHLGFFVVLSAACFGSSDLQRYKMELYEDELVWQGSNDDGRTIEMPFAFKLLDFKIEFHSPDLFVLDSAKKLASIEKGQTLNLKPWQIEIKEFLPYSYKKDPGFVAVYHYGAAPAALIVATNETTGQKKEGWVTCGSISQAPEYLDLDVFRLGMAMPRPKHFSSQIEVLTPEKKVGEAMLEVNKPYKIKGWNIYQYGYDDKLGAFSNLSIVEAVHDPWLPTVYIGSMMMLLGVIYLIFQKRPI